MPRKPQNKRADVYFSTSGTSSPLYIERKQRCGHLKSIYGPAYDLGMTSKLTLLSGNRVVII